jgi:DNA adenine methylase
MRKTFDIQNNLVPFLKWPGGKRWFIANHADLLPADFHTYIEPFLGSGTVFFYLKPSKAILGDLNPELIATYQGIKRDWIMVEELLEKHEEAHDEAYYYAVRNREPRNCVYQAARFIYLNRTCFNGIYRVNFDGQFNVPKGDRSSILFDTDDFSKISRLLTKAEIRVSDFEALIDKAKRNDFVFADPPYTVSHNINGFIKYNEHLFSWNDQVRLADALARARDRGAKIVSTNANHQSVRRIYEQRGFNLKTVSRFSSISANSQSRKQFEELIMLSDQTEEL